MRSGFKDEKFGAGVGDGADALIEDFDALGGHVFVLLVELGEVGGVGGAVSIAADAAPSDGGKKTGFVTGVIEHFPNHEGCGGFAVGASDGDNAEVLGGEVVLFGGGEGLKPVPR